MKQPLAIVLAAGKGVRMQSEKPKVLIEALGRPMIEYVLDALALAGVPRVVVVVGYQAESVKAALSGRKNVGFALQAQQRGTGDAVNACRAILADHDGPVLIVTGDSPMIQADSVRELLDAFDREKPACLMGTLHKSDPAGLGRIERDEEGRFLRIVEEKDASERQKAITEVNMSTYVFDCRELLGALSLLEPKNRQGEFYLTDCPGILRDQGKPVLALPLLRPCEALSINNRAELALVEEELRKLVPHA
jgi:bifunctional UDP-N-acetylglucosamine pyrophosphorylase/glucosamine-1-phosphate N-acetyltransferase/UDP-N-acetylglucosamine pyrophosphorylase